MTRSFAKKQLENFGAKITSAISAKTDFLIAGDNPGNKFEKAHNFGVEILNETKFIELLETHNYNDNPYT